VLGSLLTVPILSRLGSVSTAFEAFGLDAGPADRAGYTAINAIVKAELFRSRSARSVSDCRALTVSIWRQRKDAAPGSKSVARHGSTGT
jgi:hypothetical protein